MPCPIMIRLGLLLLLVVACGVRAPLPPDRVYEDARLQYRHGKLREALAEVDRTLQKIGSRTEPLWRLQLLILKSEILITQGKPADALKILDRDILPDLHSQEVQVRWRVFRARAKMMSRDFKEAGGLLEEALRLAAETDKPTLRAEVQLARASLFIARGDWISVEASARDALEYARRLSDPYLEAAAFAYLGNRCLFSSRYDEAIPWYEPSIALSEKHGYQLLGARLKHNLGICYKRLGDYEKALQLLSQAERGHGETEDVLMQEKCFGDIGNVHLHRGDLATATASYQKALALARQLQAPDDIALWQTI